MFICHVCKKHSLKNEIGIRVISALRETSYVNGQGATHGWEIVNEGLAAPSHKHQLENVVQLSTGPTILPFPVTKPHTIAPTIHTVYS